MSQSVAECVAPLLLKNPLMVFVAMSSFFLLSCGENLKQYSPKIVPPPQEYIPTAQFMAVKPSDPNGGYFVYQKEIDITEALKDVSTREKSLLPIDYEKGSAAGIHMETDYKEAQGILNHNFSRQSATFYKEGIAVVWRKDSPRTPNAIYVLQQYQGVMDFGPYLEKERFARIGHSFVSQFSIGEENQDILKDPKARRFITSLYRHLENTEEDCIESYSCSFGINPEGNYIVFKLPKMVLLFGNNARRNLVQMALIKNDDPACFKSPFDLLTAEFSCERPDNSRVVFGLGDSHKEVIEKSGISADELPITYQNISLLQKTRAVGIEWNRSNFEEKEEKIPDSAYLSAVYMRDHEYNIPFLLDQSLIKVTLGESNTVQLELEPLLPQQGKPWTIKDIEEKQKTASAKDSSYFYLSNEMPQIKGQFIVQKNLIEAFLNLLKENYKKFYYTESSYPSIYSRLLGKHNDKFALDAHGVLILSKPKGFFDLKTKQYSFFIQISIDEPSGRMSFYMSLLSDDFENYIIQNQKDALNLLEPLQELSGFKLGDRIYLRNKKMDSKGNETAIAAYPVEEGQTLFTLTDYYSERESKAVYTSGRDKNIIYEKSELVSPGGVINLYILPTLQKKDIEGHIFDEYEINKIKVKGNGSFFGTVDSICGIEGLSAKIGMYDRAFQKRLVNQIAKARSESSPDTSVTKTESSPGTPVAKAESSPDKPFKGCTYIAPQDSLFSGLRRSVFFPSHNMVLSFANRELYTVTIYKKPTKQKRKGAVQ